MFLKTFANFPPRKRLGILAILLGVISIFADNPFEKVETKVNIKEMAMISVDDISNVKVDELADDIIKSKFNFRLIDLREENEFLKYNIPSSENIQVNSLLTSDLERNEKIILYSDNDIESAQAWFLLKSNKFRGVNILDGGLKKWQEEILFPTCDCNPVPSKAQIHKHNKIAEISKFFGGKLMSVSSNSVDKNNKMPEIKAPTKITLKKAKGKKKREGC